MYLTLLMRVPGSEFTNSENSPALRHDAARRVPPIRRSRGGRGSMLRIWLGQARNLVTQRYRHALAFRMAFLSTQSTPQHAPIKTWCKSSWHLMKPGATSSSAPLQASDFTLLHQPPALSHAGPHLIQRRVSRLFSQTEACFTRYIIARTRPNACLIKQSMKTRTASHAAARSQPGVVDTVSSFPVIDSRNRSRPEAATNCSSTDRRHA